MKNRALSIFLSAKAGALGAVASLALTATAAEPDWSGLFPPSVKTVGVVMPASIQPKANFDRGGTGAQDVIVQLDWEKLAAARAEIESVKRDFAARAGCPVYDGYAYGHVAVSHAIDFRRTVSVAEDGTMTWR